ncbi:unnamed protein product [Sphagnum balticum]
MDDLFFFFFFFPTTTTLEGSPCWTVMCFPGKALAYLQADFARSEWIPFPIVRRVEKRGIIAAYFGPSHAPPPTLQHGKSGPQQQQDVGMKKKQFRSSNNVVVDCERNVLREVSFRKRIEDTKKKKKKMMISCATLAMMSVVFFFVVVFLCNPCVRRVSRAL